MIGGRSVLAVITARGGSKGLPRKNVLPFRGEPLIGWTIRAAQASSHIDRLIVSTDDPEIAAVCRAAGCDVPFIRDVALAGDTASSVDVVLDAADRVPGYDIVVLLQPTSPLRTSADIDATLMLMQQSGAPSAATVSEAPSHPFLIFRRDGGERLQAYVEPPAGQSLRRQDLPEALQLNGAVYAADLAWVRSNRTLVRAGETAAVVMPADRSADIDTWEDFLAAERLAG
ncbi:MAG TPA: acylneuraminate cytidylyltransferase family protein [Brevundimonas sp.]|nr:acylneuraminate cytidylyltransferase family protein [Brevundimonas sp.]